MDRLDALKNGVSLALALLLCYFIFKIRLFAGLSILIFFGLCFESRMTTILSKGWHHLTESLGKVTSKIILSIVFYLILTPFAFLCRKWNPQIAKQFFDNTRTSFFQDKKIIYTKYFFKNPW